MQINSKYYLITKINYLIKIILEQMHINEGKLQTFLKSNTEKTRYVLVWDLCHIYSRIRYVVSE